MIFFTNPPRCGQKRKEMKTREEILNEFGCGVIPFNEEVTMYYPAIISAMQEFADQETASLRSEIAQLRSRLDDCKRRAITGQRI